MIVVIVWLVAEPPRKVQKLSSPVITVTDSSSGQVSSSSGSGCSDLSGSSSTSSSCVSCSQTSSSSTDTSSTTVSQSCSLTGSSSDAGRSESHSSSSDHVTSQVPKVSDTVTRLSPRRAMSVESAGTTSDGRIQFVEVVGQPAAVASDGPQRLIERSTLADRHAGRMHPYRDVNRQHRWHDSSRHFNFRVYEPHRSIHDLLECHSVCSYGYRGCSNRPVSPHVLMEPARWDASGQFTSYKFVRSTRATAQKILGETGVVDELKDVAFTQDDIKHFDEKKLIAEQLDKLLDARN